jgi:WD40 repeat protein
MVCQPMPSPEPSRIFISYARQDGASLAQRLQSDLSTAGFDAWLDTQRIASGAVWSTEIEREIDTRKVTVALLSPGSYASEICRAEQLRALDQGNRVIPVLATKGADRPLYLYARQYRDFTDDANYAVRLAELLADIRGNATATLPDTYRKTRVTYLTAPPRVANYLERPEAVHALRDTLFAEDHRQLIALTALAGMGGIGKTVLAKALTDDEVVQRAFPDGIVWITAGKERKRDFIEEMREVAKALGDDLSGYDTGLACENRYRTTIANKAALIVVDDVWSKADIEPLLAESPRSRFLFTTRNAAIGRFVGAREYRADLLDVVQSRELLASWANLPVAELPAVADEVIIECGRLPLALSVVGAMLRGADVEFWTDTLDLLRKADLSAIQEQLPEGQDSFFKAVEVSFQSLKPEMQERYKALAVLLEDMAAPLPILQTLWNTSEAEARRISRNFVDHSLAQGDAAVESIRMHDLQLDYVRAQYPDKEALDLIHGAIQLSLNAIARDPSQFASQMLGRLLLYCGTPTIAAFTKRVAGGASTPWLRPLQAALLPPGTTLTRILEGHSSLVNAVALTPDGRRAISASEDKTLLVWDVEGNHPPVLLEGHRESVTCVALTPDCARAISGSADKTLRVWDLAGGQPPHVLDGHKGVVQAVALSANGNRAVSGGRTVSGFWDDTLWIWDLQQSEWNGLVKRYTRWVNALAMTADGTRVFAGCDDGTLLVSNLLADKLAEDALAGRSGSIYAVALASDGKCAVSGARDTTVTVWNLESNEPVRVLEGHTMPVKAVALTPDGKLAVSGSEDKTVRVWDLETHQPPRVLEGHTGWVNAVAVSADGTRVISGSVDKTLRVWNLQHKQPPRGLDGHREAVSALAVSSDGKLAISGSYDNTLRVWDPKDNFSSRVLEGHTGWINAVAVAPYSNCAVSGSNDHTLRVWDLEGKQRSRVLEGHAEAVSAVALTDDGEYAISASFDNTLRIWDMKFKSRPHVLKGHSDRVFAVAVSADGKRIVSGSDDKTLRVWDLTGHKPTRILEGHTGSAWVLALTADGRRAVSGSRDNTLRVWDLEGSQPPRVLQGHTRDVEGLVMTADGRRAVSWSYEKIVWVWDLEGKQPPLLLQGHTDSIESVALSSDGRFAVSGSRDKTVRVWNLDHGNCLVTYCCDVKVYSCAWSRDFIAVGDELGHVHLLAWQE